MKTYIVSTISVPFYSPIYKSSSVYQGNLLAVIPCLKIFKYKLYSSHIQWHIIYSTFPQRNKWYTDKILEESKMETIRTNSESFGSVSNFNRLRYLYHSSFATCNTFLSLRCVTFPMSHCWLIYGFGTLTAWGFQPNPSFPCTN